MPDILKEIEKARRAGMSDEEIADMVHAIMDSNRLDRGGIATLPTGAIVPRRWR